MRYHPDTLGEARETAIRLNYETKDGGLGTEFCPNCQDGLFVVEGYNADGTVAYGYCMTPGCGYERSADEAKTKPLIPAGSET